MSFLIRITSTNILLLLGSFLITVLCQSCTYRANDKHCEQFKNGKFIFHMRGPQGDVFFLIERQDSIQIETEKATGSFSRLAVKWTGNCTYELKLLETNFAFSDSIQQIRKNIPLRSQIIQWTGDYYVFRATRDNSDFVMTDTLWIDQ